MKLRMIISGGQTGADMGGLLAGMALRFETGGTAPRGWMTEEGPRRGLLRVFGLDECERAGYLVRTKANISMSDGTLIVCNPSLESPGTLLTKKICKEQDRPNFTMDFPYKSTAQVLQCLLLFQAWLKSEEIRILNVAGNRESLNPGIQAFTTTFIIQALM